MSADPQGPTVHSDESRQGSWFASEVESCLETASKSREVQGRPETDQRNGKAAVNPAQGPKHGDSSDSRTWLKFVKVTVANGTSCRTETS